MIFSVAVPSVFKRTRLEAEVVNNLKVLSSKSVQLQHQNEKFTTNLTNFLHGAK